MNNRNWVHNRKRVDDEIDSLKIQTIYFLSLYHPELKTKSEARQLKESRTLNELQHLLSIRRLYSQTYGNPEGEQINHDDM